MGPAGSLPIVLEEDVRMEISADILEVVGAIKTIGQRHAVDVPLARVVGPIAHRPEHLRKQLRPFRTYAGSAALHTWHRIPADLLGVIARQDGRPRRPAPRGIIELREPQSAGRQPVQVRRPDLAAIATQIRVAQVIGHDDDNIGTRRTSRWIGSGWSRPGQQRGQDGHQRAGRCHGVSPSFVPAFVAIAHVMQTPMNTEFYAGLPAIPSLQAERALILRRQSSTIDG